MRGRVQKNHCQIFSPLSPFREEIVQNAKKNHVLMTFVFNSWQIFLIT